MEPRLHFGIKSRCQVSEPPEYYGISLRESNLYAGTVGSTEGARIHAETEELPSVITVVICRLLI